MVSKKRERKLEKLRLAPHFPTAEFITELEKKAAIQRSDCRCDNCGKVDLRPRFQYFEEEGVVVLCRTCGGAEPSFL